MTTPLTLPLSSTCFYHPGLLHVRRYAPPILCSWPSSPHRGDSSNCAPLLRKISCDEFSLAWHPFPISRTPLCPPPFSPSLSYKLHYGTLCHHMCTNVLPLQCSFGTISHQLTILTLRFPAAPSGPPLPPLQPPPSILCPDLTLDSMSVDFCSYHHDICLDCFSPPSPRSF